MAQLSPQQLALAQAYLDAHGDEAFEMAMTSGHLFSSTMRAGSKMALQTSARYVEAQLDCSLLYQFAPRASKAGERTELQLITGPASLVLRDVGPTS